MRDLVCGESILDMSLLKRNTKYSGEFSTFHSETAKDNKDKQDKQGTKDAKDAKDNEEAKEAKEVDGPASHRVVRWLWRILEERFTNQERMNFLMFVWGRKRLPAASKATEDWDTKMEVIGDASKTVDSLPTSATCFFRITLSPWYETMEQLEKHLRYSMMYSDLDGDDMGEIDRSAFL
jgi:hypothetical protein